MATSSAGAGSINTIFARAAAVFPGWTDPETGVRVLRLHTRGTAADGAVWSTVYHQLRCFLHGGRQVLLRAAPPGRRGWYFLLDLTTGEEVRAFPEGQPVLEVADGTFTALVAAHEGGCAKVRLWDMRAGAALAELAEPPGWSGLTANLLADGRRAVAATFRRRAGNNITYGPLAKASVYEHAMVSRHYLLAPGAAPELIFEADGFFCNHVVGCPTDPELYAYNRWLTPKRDVPSVLHLRSLDGRIDAPVPLAPDAIRPVDMFGVRDHYLWTPDGRGIVSYFCPHWIPLADPAFNHFKLEWWLSVLDLRTGADVAAKYPPRRWGGHMQLTPDGSHVVCAGGPGFDKLFAVSIGKLRQGWNERIICSYPAAVSAGNNADPFPFPFVLPDGSGVIFNAGWPGPEHGVYLAEWNA